MAADYGWLMKDRLIDEKPYCVLGYELTEKDLFTNLTN